MSCASFTTATNGAQANKNQISPQLGQGIYAGIYYPGSTQKVVSTIGSFLPNLGAEVVIQNDTNYISSLTQAPKNVLRLTGANGNSYIQSKQNLYFSKPYSGVGMVTIDCSNGKVDTNYLQANQILNINGPNGQGGQTMMVQNNTFTLNGTSSITTVSLFVDTSGTLKANFNDANGNIKWTKLFS